MQTRVQQPNGHVATLLSLFYYCYICFGTDAQFSALSCAIDQRCWIFQDIFLDYFVGAELIRPVFEQCLTGKRV